ncbi:MAG: LysM domain-containing protein [Polynucleobacter sp.]|nr:MAG: LysM domain-containing protein [Polynucleobacter sp.]
MAKKDKDQLRPAVPQPTKRDMVIARRQAQAAAGDTPISIAKANNIPVEDLLAANPGVVTVRPGQVLAVPKPSSGEFMPSSVPQQNNPFAGSQAMVGAGTVGGQPNLGNYNTPYNGFQTPTTSGFKAPTPYAGYTGTAGYGGVGTVKPPASQVNFQTPPTIGFQAPQQPYLGASSYLNPAIRPPTQQTTAPATPMFPTDANGNPIPYTGNPNDPNTQAWKNYWNASARAGVDLAGRISTPKVMTREQIWEMKAAQRRRQSANTSPGSFSYDTREPMVNPELVRQITWGI